MPDVAVGMAEVVAMTLVVAGVLWLLAHVFDIADLTMVWARRLGLREPLPQASDRMPIERIAADLRRIRPEARHLATGMPMARRRAIVAAYDEVLLDACRALEVPTELDRMTDALERESERLRTEAELERAGVDLG
jgi:hypothetical protein